MYLTAVTRRMVHQGLFLFAAAAWCLIAAPAGGQLSEEDLDALRAQGEREGWTFTVSANPATRRPPEALCGLVVPEEWWVGAPFDPCTPPPRGLPSAFDWRELDGCTPVRNQGGCGSCWAFAAVGAFECSIRVRDGVTVDLSEQWLVSCTEAGSCSGGWHSEAFRYFLFDGLTDPCGDDGAVLEQYFPYVAWDKPCGCPYPHEYFLDGWSFIGVDGGVAPTDAIKQAIIEHGPVAVGVHVNSAFSAYSGGIFNACAEGAINHAVVLVGWDDDQGEDGVWFLRNSWGAGWGEGGYMRLGYGCSRVGYAAAYVDYGTPDCNGNGIPDAQDIADGTSEDCNANGRPDECDLLYGTSPDANDNDLPDECEACNAAKLLAADGEDQDVFGCSVAVSGDVAVIGARGEDTLGDNAGAAYVFRYRDGAWTQEARLTAADGAAGDRFGKSVAVSGDVALVGAYGDDDGGDYAGAAYVYRFDGTTWRPEAKLLASDGESGAVFGAAVAIDGDVAVVGARGDGDDAGAAYVYRHDGGAWIEEAKLTAADAAAEDYFGYAVAVRGEHVIIGAYGDDDRGDLAGAAYVSHFDGAEWAEPVKLLASDGDTGDFFGYSVALGDDLALVGAYLDEENGDYAGAAYVYRLEGATWSEEAKLLASDGAAADRFGHAVGIDDDLAVVGAHRDDDRGDDSGSAYAFRYDGGQWRQQAKPQPIDGGAADQFGYALAVDGDNAIIGALGVDDEGGGAGAAYIFAGLDRLDCNDNGVFDACDIRDGASFDCNSNFIPDLCDIADGTSEDADGNGIPDECECTGDLDGDGTVGTADLLALLGAWGASGGPADLNEDGLVDTADLLALLAAWGECP
ncbi:MAG: C1 family peptidase [Planctomycetota bacterium]|nr:C1 family peptidase [Planctomycetota bacterium]